MSRKSDRSGRRIPRSGRPASGGTAADRARRSPAAPAVRRAQPPSRPRQVRTSAGPAKHGACRFAGPCRFPGPCCFERQGWFAGQGGRLEGQRRRKSGGNHPVGSFRGRRVALPRSIAERRRIDHKPRFRKSSIRTPRDSESGPRSPGNQRRATSDARVARSRGFAIIAAGCPAVRRACSRVRQFALDTSAARVAQWASP